MSMTYFNGHSHTMYSNIRLLDCTNKPEDLIKTAKELGLSGLAITDHESLGAAVTVNKIAKKMRETDPNFTIALGNEIYLVDQRGPRQKYFHFILIAKDRLGFRGLCELSSTAWYNMYVDRGLERVPLTKEELVNIIPKYKGHLIATSACLGGELSTYALMYAQARSANDIETAEMAYNKILEFVDFCINVFGDDFYIECAPSTRNEQVTVNRILKGLAEYKGIKMVVATDAHYLTKKDRYVHKAFLTSKEGEREVDAFYEFARLMSPDECKEILMASFDDEEFIDELFKNTLEVQSKIEFYSLEQSQQVTEVEVKDYPKDDKWLKETQTPDKWPILKSLFESDNIQERYWVNQCFEGLMNKGIGLKENYIDRLEEEADVKKSIGEKLHTCMFAYPNTLQHYIDLFWNCGSTVGAGRGSACAGLNHYLLGVTQLDPIEWSLPFWRYLNKSREELGDIDLDLSPSKLPRIFEEIRKERGELGLVQVCTYGTETSKSAILTACRGYRSEDYSDGIDPDDAQYLSSLVPIERGFVWSIDDMVNGNEEKDRIPQTQFINAVNQYPGLLDVIRGVEGLISRRGIHASGVLLQDNDTVFDHGAVMRAPSGALTTQQSLHDAEFMGAVKYDFLLTSVQDIITKAIELLQADGQIEPELTLRQAYDKYLHPNVLPRDDKKMWDALAEGSVVSCFQFDSPVGALAAKKIRPTNPLEMADANGLMRLMAADGAIESPMDKYVRFKNNISLWYKEMRDAGLTIEEQTTLEPYFKQSYGVPPSQEQLMKMLMDKDICDFSLAEANDARKIVGKKQMSRIPELHAKVLEKAKSKNLGQYVWSNGIGPQMGYSFSVVMALTHLTYSSQGYIFKSSLSKE